MGKIYIPEYNENSCVSILDYNTIRVYEKTPTLESNVTYRDYFINSNYIYYDGVEEFNEGSYIPLCLKNENLTNDFYYRNDLDRILIIFLIFSIFAIYLPLKIFVRLGRRFQ